MADIGQELKPEFLWLTKNRDFKSSLEFIDVKGVSGPWPAGDLWLELYTTPAHLQWHYVLSGSTATITVPAAIVDTVPETPIGWQLVWKPATDTGTGECVALGCVEVQTPCCDN
jgi:hypothetical protein